MPWRARLLIVAIALAPSLGLAVSPALAAGAVAAGEWARAITGDVNSAPWPPPPARVSWTSPIAPTGPVTRIKLLGFNDFHGNLEPPTPAGARAAGGAAVLAAYLAAAQRGWRGRTLILHAGDHVGASPPISRLLQDEPAIDFLNLIAGPECAAGVATRFFDAAGWREHPNHCNAVGTLGNHEFDRGPVELLRLLQGGNLPGTRSLDAPYTGSRVPYVCANVIDRRTGRALLPPYAVVSVAGLPVGVIGAVMRGAPEISPIGVALGLDFLDEADAINAAAAELTTHGIHTLVVIIHQGVVAVPTTTGLGWRGPLASIVARLEPTIDVVISGHTHGFTNALLPNAAHQPVLVTQAYSYGLAYADIELAIDRRSLAVVSKSARIVPTWADSGPGRRPQARVLALVESAARAVAPEASRVIAVAAEPITRAPSDSGETALGNLVADAERAVAHADIALVNAGGMRVDLDRGPISWGRILAVHPYGNRLATVELSGEQLLRLLEEQWPEGAGIYSRILKPSGLSYVWDPARAVGSRIVAACDGEGHRLEPGKTYRVAINDYLARGGDGFVSLKDARGGGPPGPTDAEALAQYLAGESGPVDGRVEGRIARVDHPAGARCAVGAQPP